VKSPLRHLLGSCASAHGMPMEDYRQFLERRMREELERSETEETERMRRLHWRWAGMYRERLKSLTGTDLDFAA